MSNLEQTLEWREHWNVALRFRQRGIEELRAGEDLVGSELMWGAAARATKAVAAHMGMSHGSHRELFWVARRLSNDSGIQGLQELLGDASALHIHFYESHLEPDEMEIHVESANRFIEAVASIFGEEIRATGIERCADSDNM